MLPIVAEEALEDGGGDAVELNLMLSQGLGPFCGQITKYLCKLIFLDVVAQ